MHIPFFPSPCYSFADKITTMTPPCHCMRSLVSVVFVLPTPSTNAVGPSSAPLALPDLRARRLLSCRLRARMESTLPPAHQVALLALPGSTARPPRVTKIRKLHARRECTLSEARALARSVPKVPIARTRPRLQKRARRGILQILGTKRRVIGERK